MDINSQQVVAGSGGWGEVEIEGSVGAEMPAAFDAVDVQDAKERDLFESRDQAFAVAGRERDFPDVPAGNVVALIRPTFRNARGAGFAGLVRLDPDWDKGPALAQDAVGPRVAGRHGLHAGRDDGMPGGRGGGVAGETIELINQVQPGPVHGRLAGGRNFGGPKGGRTALGAPGLRWPARPRGASRRLGGVDRRERREPKPQRKEERRSRKEFKPTAHGQYIRHGRWTNSWRKIGFSRVGVQFNHCCFSTTFLGSSRVRSTKTGR